MDLYLELRFGCDVPPHILLFGYWVHAEPSPDLNSGTRISSVRQGRAS